MSLQTGGKDLGETSVQLNRLIGFEVKDQGVRLRFATSAGEQVVRARRLILAMPRRSLELIAPYSPLLLQPKVQRLVNAVTPRPLFKLFTTYDTPWWMSAGEAARRM